MPQGKHHLFGSVTKLARKDAQLSLRKAASKFGFSAAYLCAIESGKIQPKPKLIDQICKNYSCTKEKDSFFALAEILPPDVKKIIFNNPHKFFKLIRKTASK